MRQRHKSSSNQSPSDEKGHKNTPSSGHWMHEFFYSTLWEPHPASSLAFFRICWGIIMFYECVTWMRSDWSKLEYVLQLRVRFKYYGFDFIEPW